MGYPTYLESNMCKKYKDKVNKYADSRMSLTEPEKYDQMGARKLETTVPYPECDTQKKASRLKKDAGNLAYKESSKVKGQGTAEKNGVKTTLID